MRLPSNGMPSNFSRGSAITFLLTASRGLPVAIDDPGKHHDLVLLRHHGTRKRGELAIGHVVADAFDVIERTVLHPDRAGRFRQRLVSLDLVLRHGQHETIDIGHHGSPWCVCPKDDAAPDDPTRKRDFRMRQTVARRRGAPPESAIPRPARPKWTAKHPASQRLPAHSRAGRNPPRLSRDLRDKCHRPQPDKSTSH